MIGMLVGLIGSLWLQRRIRHRVERFLPDRLPSTAADMAGSLAETMKQAVSEGREAMREREAELRQLSRPFAETTPAASTVDPSLSGAELVVLPGPDGLRRATP